MTREEFMKHAEQEIDIAFRGQKNRMMNLVEQAWAEGKRNAEVDVFKEAGSELVDYVKREFKLPTVITTDKTFDTFLSVAEACKTCPNLPSNGGVCFCALRTEVRNVLTGGMNHGRSDQSESGN